MGKAERQQRRLAEGWQALERGDLRSAEATARDAAPDSVSAVEVARLLGASLFLQGRFPEAAAPLRKVYLETRERNLGCQLGHCYLAAGDPGNAQKVLEQVTAAFPDFGEALNLLGIALIHQARHADAVRVFTSALERSPYLPATHNNLGNALLQLGRHEEAIALFQKAIALEPGSFQAHDNLGRAYKGLRRYDASVESYREALRLAPGNHEVHNNLGTVLAEMGRHDEAISSYRAALALNPRHSLAHNNLGVAFDTLGRHAEAIECFKAALALRPDYIEAHANLGIAYQQLERFDEAIACYQKAIALKPDDAGAHTGLGLALQELGRPDEAVACHLKALSISPDFAEAHFNLGMAYQKQRRLEQAIACYEKAIAVKPDHANAHANLGAACLEQEQFDRAIVACEKAIALEPDLASAHFNLGLAFRNLKRLEEAAVCFERALAVKPDHKYAFSALAWTQAIACDWRDRDARVEALRAHVREGLSVVDPFAFLVACEELDEQKLCAERYLADTLPAGLPASHESGTLHHEKIRIAYLSADFCEHATAQLAAGLFELHDTSRFETIGVSFGPDDGSAMRKRVSSSFGRFSDVRGMSDSEVARMLRELEVDIAVDLKGHTTGSRVGILAGRPAPIQVSYLGYPGTMGAGFIDYILADEFVLPPGHQPFYAEKAVYLPDSYQVNDSKRRIAERTPARAEVGLPQEGFVFCCFNNSYKITPPMFDIWMRLLRSVPGSVLWLLRDNALAEENLRKEARARSVEPHQLVFAPRMKLDEHLARHRLADLFLDTLPCNAHTTASDALWAGLPVLSCAGGSFAGRVAGSLLRAVGLPELASSNLEEYEALALTLASDQRRLAAIRRKLERNRSMASLFDVDRFRRHIESAYTTMWEIRMRGERPRAFAVEPGAVN